MMMDNMTEKQADLAWRLMTELRKEILTAQQIRAKVIEIKITFVAAAVGLIIANLGKLQLSLMVIPSFAAIFFDFLINSYSVSIKRIGRYCRMHIEPKLHQANEWPSDDSLWEEFMKCPDQRQWLSLIGNIGLTTLVLIPTLVTLFAPFTWNVSFPLSLGLVFLFALDVRTHLKPRWITENEKT
jgi:hypothetical protein